MATISSGCVLSVIALCFSIVIKKIKISEPLKSKAVTEPFKMRLHLRYITAVQNVCALLTEDQANNITALALTLGKFSKAKPGTIQVTKTGL